MESAAYQPGYLRVGDLPSRMETTAVLSVSMKESEQVTCKQSADPYTTISISTEGSCAASCPAHAASAIENRNLMRALDEADRVIRDLKARIDVLEHLAMMDELTGILNRRGFSAKLRQMLARNKRLSSAGQPLAGLLMLFDLNDFKLINDVHGHPAGDLVLQGFARHLVKHVRAEDAVARLGGDEFAVLLTGILSDHGLAAAERLADRLGEFQVLIPSGESLTVTAACGWSLLQADDTETMLLSRVDQALYRHKALKAG